MRAVEKKDRAYVPHVQVAGSNVTPRSSIVVGPEDVLFCTILPARRADNDPSFVGQDQLYPQDSIRARLAWALVTLSTQSTQTTGQESHYDASATEQRQPQ
jgi:uncharacterized protein YbjT (DUF2867 family)